MLMVFPGMDPYLENPEIFPGIHSRTVVYLADQLPRSDRLSFCLSTAAASRRSSLGRRTDPGSGTMNTTGTCHVGTGPRDVLRRKRRQCLKVFSRNMRARCAHLVGWDSVPTGSGRRPNLLWLRPKAALGGAL
jgi:hypothetical protein